jgi:hypothetical protein
MTGGQVTQFAVAAAAKNGFSVQAYDIQILAFNKV